MRLEVALRPLEVVREAAEPLLEPALGPRDLLDQPLGGPALAGLERRPALLREASLLGGEQRCGLGSLPREHAPDLLGVSGRLGGNDLAHGAPRVVDELVGCGRCPPCPPEREPEAGRHDHGHSEAHAEDPDRH